MIYSGDGKEKWTIYLVDYFVDDGGEELENWVRFQEEHIVKRNYYPLIWVVIEFVT